MNQPTQPQQNPSLTELRSIRRELSALREEFAAARAQAVNQKPPDITDQVAKGVVLAGVFWFVIVFVLQILFQRIQ
jgi:hypothetical protein